jgi:hypothetical protein
MQSHYTISTIGQYPRQESNLICDLRKVACEPAHSEDVHLPLQWTRRESNPHYRHARPASSHWTTGPLTNQYSGQESNLGLDLRKVA